MTRAAALLLVLALAACTNGPRDSRPSDDAVDDPARAAAVEAAQARINAWRSLSNSYVQIPTIKAMLGLQTGNAGWNRVRPPMLPLNAAEFATLQQNFAALP